MLKRIKRALPIILVLILIAAIYLYFENTALQVTEYQIADKNIPDSFDGFKIAQISDYHNVKYQKMVDDLTEQLEKAQPDIIVITGDLLDARRPDIDAASEIARRAVEIAPVYYVMGNHEARYEDYPVLKEELEKAGVVILDKSCERIEKGSEAINIIGIDDPCYYHEEDIYMELAENELSSIEYNKNDYTILLSHQPELFQAYVDAGVNLVFSGHAHGGQIRIPFIGGLIAPQQGWFPKYTQGTFEQDGTVMVVSRGIGNSLFPFRVNNRPELVVAELKSR